MTVQSSLSIKISLTCNSYKTFSLNVAMCWYYHTSDEVVRSTMFYTLVVFTFSIMARYEYVMVKLEGVPKGL